MKKLLSLVFAVSLLVVPTVTLAALETELPKTDAGSIDATITTIGNVLFGALLLIALIYILLAAISFITAQGDAAKLKVAQDRVLYALIGIAVAVLAQGMIALVRNLVYPEGTNQTQQTEQTETSETT
jgi:uncharacterized membrane protein YedE/YeeE